MRVCYRWLCCRPDKLEVASGIVRTQLAAIDVIGRDQQSVPSSITRSRQHQWFINKTDDPVDQLLIDETFQDDLSWQNYNRAIERTVFMITDDIFDNVLLEVALGFAEGDGDGDGVYLQL